MLRRLTRYAVVGVDGRGVSGLIQSLLGGYIDHEDRTAFHHRRCLVL